MAADDLGTAVLRITVDDSAARTTLETLRKEVAEVSRTTSSATTSTTRRRTTTPNVGEQDFTDIARRFNLRGVVRTLETLSTELAQLESARGLNLSTSWTKFISQLEDTKADIDSIAAGKDLNIRSSWTKFLGQLEDTKADIDAASADARTRQRQQARKQAVKRRNDILSNALIGGAFPALFGQGIGASVGGALGGGAGGAIGGQFGFGLSLVGTALGAAFDQALEKGRTLARGLDDPIGQFNALREAGILSSKALEKNVGALIENGRQAEAAALIQQDLLQTFGSQQGLKDYNDAVDTLSRSFTTATTILAAFVAGPLADLIKRLNTSNFQIAIRQEQLAGQLTPAQYAQADLARVQATEQSRKSRGGISAFLPPSEGDVAAGRQAFIKTAEKLLGVEKQRAKTAADVAYAQTLTKQQQDLTYKSITASVQGYKLQSLELEKQTILNKRNQELFALAADEKTGSKAQAINQKAAEDTARVNEQINEIKQDQLATEYLITAQTGLQLRSLDQQIANVKELGTVEAGVARDTLRQRQEVLASIQAAKDKEAEIGARITAARLRGGTEGEAEASRLVQEQKVAAKETKLAILEGAQKLVDAGKSLRDNLRQGILSLTEIRSDPQGLNRFLNPVQRQERAQASFQQLLPVFREAQSRFTQLTGAAAPEFRGTVEDVNASIRDFVTQVDREFNAQRNVENIQQALVTVNENLITALNNLVGKDWNVAVNVAANGQTAVYGDALSKAVSP